MRPLLIPIGILVVSRATGTPQIPFQKGDGGGVVTFQKEGNRNKTVLLCHVRRQVWGFRGLGRVCFIVHIGKHICIY